MPIPGISITMPEIPPLDPPFEGYRPDIYASDLREYDRNRLRDLERQRLTNLVTSTVYNALSGLLIGSGVRGFGPNPVVDVSVTIRDGFEDFPVAVSFDAPAAPVGTTSGLYRVDFETAPELPPISWHERLMGDE